MLFNACFINAQHLMYLFFTFSKKQVVFVNQSHTNNVSESHDNGVFPNWLASRGFWFVEFGLCSKAAYMLQWFVCKTPQVKKKSLSVFTKWQQLLLLCFLIHSTSLKRNPAWVLSSPLAHHLSLLTIRQLFFFFTFYWVLWVQRGILTSSPVSRKDVIGVRGECRLSVLVYVPLHRLLFVALLSLESCRSSFYTVWHSLSGSVCYSPHSLIKISPKFLQNS